jgi:hypothetical protein
MLAPLENVYEPKAWVLVGLVLSLLATVLGAQDAQRTEHYLCPYANLEGYVFFSHMLPYITVSECN